MLAMAAELGPLPDRMCSYGTNITHIRAVLTSAIFFAPHFFSVQNITWPSGLLSTSFLAITEDHSVNWDQILYICRA